MLCDYGCGQDAAYQFKNGKWCCKDHWARCSNMIENHRQNNIGRKFSKKSRNKMSESQKGRTLSKETRNKMSESRKGRTSPMKGRKLSKSHRKKIGETQKINIVIIKERYLIFSKIENMRYNPDKPGEKEIQVHCKNNNCKNSKEQGGWFTPTKNQFESRRYALESENGNEGAYFYCCDKCKDECPLYNKRISQLIKHDKIKSGFIDEELYTSEEYQIFRKVVLDREDYICEYCDELATHVHHSRPQKLEPGFILDPDFGVACCQECHYKYGHKTGTECSTGNLASKICN